MINFDEMIDNYLFRKFRPKGVGRYYPSEAGMCLRKVWYTYKYPKETEPELLKIFEMGNILHNFVVEVLKSEKNPDVELVKSELPVKIQMDDIIVIYALYKMIKLALRIAMVAVAGMLFPIFMNYFLDWGIPISLNTIIFYATSAVVLYLVAIFVGGILRFFGIFLKPFSESRKIKKIGQP